MSDPTVMDYLGQDRQGQRRTGYTTEDPVVFTQKRYQLGWLRLSLWSPRAGAQGDVLVGHIGPDSENPGGRTWWAGTR